MTSPSELTIKYPFEKVNASELVKFLFLVHERKGLKPAFEFKVYTRDMKKLLEELGPEKTIALILKAGEVCNHPFSIKFLRRLNED